MVFDRIFQPFIEASPVSVIFRGTLENVFSAHGSTLYDAAKSILSAAGLRSCQTAVGCDGAGAFGPQEEEKVTKKRCQE